MRKALVILVSMFTITNNINHVFCETIHSRPKNYIGKIKFIKKNLQSNRKYDVLQNLKLFKKVLIGVWSMDAGEIEFYKNGIVKIYQYDSRYGESKKSKWYNVIIKGTWKIVGKNLILKFKKTSKLNIEYFVSYCYDKKKVPLYKHKTYLFCRMNIVFSAKEVNRYGITELWIEYN